MNKLLTSPMSGESLKAEDRTVLGEFVDFAGDRYYAIRNVDWMPPFFLSLVSSDDHWMFLSSSGGLTAGRVSPETALFPYVPVDRIHESAPHTGSRTLMRVHGTDGQCLWEPFNRDHDGRYRVSRNLYKNLLGNKLCFEEINHDLQLAFRYTWMTSRFGFVRLSELNNLGDGVSRVDLIDGIQNVLPAGTPLITQNLSSNLVDAYKWTELDGETGLACYTLYAGITDRAEPFESLKATTVFCLGLERSQVLISSEALNEFRRGKQLHQVDLTRGVRGAYLVSRSFGLSPGSSRSWKFVADVEKSQSDVVRLRQLLQKPAELSAEIDQSVTSGCDDLARIMAAVDGFQATAESNVATHHYANVLFNTLRGGIFDDQYSVSAHDFRRSIRHFNRRVFERNQDMLADLPERLHLSTLRSMIAAQGDAQLSRLTSEYLPITFGRRHGDPSRPWNLFTIRLRDEQGERLLSYEGNWRDIFQNWEALLISYPGFVDGVIAKFVNASTVDGHNPYRITKNGIDWEVEKVDDPWSHIGYWGDHQIIYLAKLLELSRDFYPDRLNRLLHEPIYSYANVPYRIKPFDALVENPKNTVVFDHELASEIDHRVDEIGADGKLLLDKDREIYCVNLLEKLLVPLLAKLGNLIVDGGIWLNTQLPEWNDANNALVGHGLSMVTLCYMRRYVAFLRHLIAIESGPFELSCEVANWLTGTATVLRKIRLQLDAGPIDGAQRLGWLNELGREASRYREQVYQQEGFSGKREQPMTAILGLLDDALPVIDHSIAANRCDDNLYHAYNVMEIADHELSVGALYPMLEGQVAALSSGALGPNEAVAILEALFDSEMYRPDQHSFMLYPDRALSGFLQKNRINDARVESIPLLVSMLAQGDRRIVEWDAEGCCRFNAHLISADFLDAQLSRLSEEYGEAIDRQRSSILALYEEVFLHREFTGRSGTMFGFEGLGSIYWHMVSKLLLAIQENFLGARDSGAEDQVCHRLGQLYYRVRAGIGFNKTPAEYGAFPTDPYSHTPKHAGARQPGMTGQVKEEILTRLGELGVQIHGGAARFEPVLLRATEFTGEPRTFRYLDVDEEWQDLDLPCRSLAFTWCQVPVIYRLNDGVDSVLTVLRDDGSQGFYSDSMLPVEEAAEVFERSGRVRQISVSVSANLLFEE